MLLLVEARTPARLLVPDGCRPSRLDRVASGSSPSPASRLDCRRCLLQRCGYWVATGRTLAAWGPLWPWMRSTCPGQQLILAHQHEPGPIGLEQQLGRVHHLLEGLGKSSWTSRVVRCRCLLPGRPFDAHRPRPPSLDEPFRRDRGSRGQRDPARGHPPAASVTRGQHSSTSHWVRRRAALGWPQVRREGPGWRPRGRPAGWRSSASPADWGARALTLIACSHPEAATQPGQP